MVKSRLTSAHVQVSTGAQNDLEKITQMAYSTVAVYGMNAKIGLVSFPPDRNRMDKPYSDETAQTIDREARAIIDSCYQRTLTLLREKKDFVEALAQVRPHILTLRVFAVGLSNSREQFSAAKDKADGEGLDSAVVSLPAVRAASQHFQELR